MRTNSCCGQGSEDFTNAPWEKPTMSGRYARLPISPEFLHEILDLPADVRIIGVQPSDCTAPWDPIELRLEPLAAASTTKRVHVSKNSDRGRME